MSGRRAVATQGWDSHAEVVDGRWLERTPRRPEIRPLLEAEARLMPRLAPRLPFTVPVPEVVDNDGPWRVRHVLVPGEPIVRDRLDAYDGRRVGEFLRALHDTPPAVWADMGIVTDAVRVPMLEEMTRAVVPLLPAEHREAGHALLRRCQDASDRRVLRHGDLGPEHLLTTDGRITGVIDWTDVALGDPALDLAWLVHRTPTVFADALVAAYGATPEEILRGRDWHLLGPWWEVRHGLTGGGEEYVASGLDGVVARLRE